ncbi:LysR family transcriptional regulator [Amycolatopsis sp. NPDC058986]|uniref:LysR family transcriptional regulator n=1 Tax=unclassified Amycolatopsis TaxID=2618356 RepID=UPI00366AE519
MGLDIRHLETFLAAVEEGSITAAARRLRLAQPAVSRTLAQLERHVGVALLARSAHGVTATAEGEIFRIRAAAALASFTDAVERPFGDPRPLRVGHAWSAFGEHTSAVLRHWRASRPEQPLELCRLDDPYAGMAGGRIDVSVLRGPQPRPGYRSELLYSETRVAAVSMEHRLARRRELRLADLAGEGLVVQRHWGTTTPELWDAEARPAVAVEVGSVDDWQSNIAANNGVGITPASSSKLHPHAEIVYVPLADAPPVPVFLAWAPNSRHPALEDFIRTARDVVHGAPESPG